MKIYIARSNGWTKIVDVYTTKEEAEKAVRFAERDDAMAGGCSSFWVDEYEVKEKFENPYEKK